MIVRRIVFLSICVFGLATIAAAQTVSTRPQRGFMPTGDYISSPVDTIDPVMGGLTLQIPLGSLAPGHGGFGFDLDMIYNSHIYDTQIDPSSGATELVSQMTTGGWTYNILNYKVDFEDRPSYSDCQELDPRDYRVHIALPDGSEHVMHMLGEESTEGGEDGFISVNMNGTPSPCAALNGQQTLSGPLTYYSTDGTFLKMQVTPDSTKDWTYQVWTLYFPDGRYVVGKGPQVTDLYDPNGNHIQVVRTFADEAQNQPVVTLVDDFGRQLQIQFNATDADLSDSTTKEDLVVLQTGPNSGDQITWTINWSYFVVGTDYTNSNHEYLCGLSYGYCYLTAGNLWMVSSIQLPSTPSTTYQFAYSNDSDSGYGELNDMVTPTGADYHYHYTYEHASQPPTAYQISQTNAVSQKTIADGSTGNGCSSGIDFCWTYNFTDTSSTFTDNTTGAITTYSYFDRSENALSWDKGLLYQINQPDGAVDQRVWTQNPTYGISAGSFDADNPFIQIEATTIGNSSGTPTESARVDYAYDKNGNLIDKMEYDWGAYNANPVDTGGPQRRETKYSYYVPTFGYGNTSNDSNAYWQAYQSGHNRLNALQREEIWDVPSSTIAAVTEYQYDNAYANGNPTAVMRWDNTKSATAPPLGGLTTANSQILTRKYDPSGDGDLTDIYGPEVVTHVVYGPLQPPLPGVAGPYPTTIYYGYGSTVQRTWTYSWDDYRGALNSKVDVDNDIITSYVYDALNRPTLTKETYQNTDLRETQTAYDDLNRTVTVLQDLFTLGDGNLQSITQYDQLGRTTKVRTSDGQALSQSNGIEVDTNYINGASREVITSTPYRSSTDATLEWKCTSYDPLNRIISVGMYVGGAQYPTDCTSASNRTGNSVITYDAGASGLHTRTTDPTGKVQDQYSDALKRLTSVVEDPSNLNYTTLYSYDALDNLTQVTQGTQPSRVFSYSSLGRLTSVQNPETGLISYSYFDSGNVQTRSDLRGYSVTYAYDALLRMQSKTYVGGGTPNVTYSYYTSGTPNIGQLASVSSIAATTSYSYDSLGHISTMAEGIDGNAPYTLGYTYFLNDELETMQYPSGNVVNYTVDNAGRPTSAKTTARNYATNATYEPDGRLFQMQLGNQLWETRNFAAPNTTTNLNLGTTAGASDLMQLSYIYSGMNNNGNLLSHVIRHGTTSWTQNFTYDNVNRIASASEVAQPNAAGYSQTYNYDQWGNRSQSTSAVTYWDTSNDPSYSGAYDPATNHLTLSSYSYDQAGNLSFYAPYTLSYDAENRLLSATASQNRVVNFAYDGDGKRIKKVANGTTTYYVYDLEGHVIAEYSNAAIQSTQTAYPMTDLLGSIRAVTGDQPANGGTAPMTECDDYLPYGWPLSAGDNARSGAGCYPSNPLGAGATTALEEKFTGKERDVETDMDNFLARYNAPLQGRFLSPDPMDMLPERMTDPQQWNLYSYVRNAPTSLIDPTGMCTLGVDGTAHDDADGPCVNPNDTTVTVTANPPSNTDDIVDLILGKLRLTALRDTASQASKPSTQLNVKQSTSGSCSLDRALAAVPGATPTGLNNPVDGHLEVGISVSEAILTNAGFQFYSSPFGPNGYRRGNVIISGHVNAVNGQLSPQNFANSPSGSVDAQVHFDTFNPSTGLFGLAGHAIWDYLIGKLFFQHSAGLDKGC